MITAIASETNENRPTKANEKERSSELSAFTTNLQG
jgi:hypothetical protein